MTFESFQIDKLNLLTLNKGYDAYLLVSLNNGYLLVFNLYINILSNLLSYGLDLKLLFRLSNIFKLGSYIHEIT